MPRILLLPMLCIVISCGACSPDSNTSTSGDDAVIANSDEHSSLDTDMGEETAIETKVKSRPLILVTGITGRQGGAVAHQLLQRGYKLRGFTRDSSKPVAMALSELGVDMYEGDFADEEAVRNAIDGVYGIFLNTPPIADEVAMGKSVIDAARQASIRHLVFTSYMAADPEHGVASLPKAALESYLGESGVPHTIFRPVTFMENFNRTGVKARIQANGMSDPRQASTVRQYISVDDIGYFVADAFDAPESWQGRALNIAGDEFTGTELAEILTRVMGTEINYVAADWEEWGRHVPAVLPVIYRWFEDTGYRADIPALRKQHPQLRSLESFLRNNGWEG